MKASVSAVLCAALLSAIGCRRESAQAEHRPKTKGTESVSVQHHIDKVETKELNSALAAASTTSDADKRFVMAEVSADIYEYVSVRIYVKNGERLLEIDALNYDEWVHSVTGERGKSPHDTHTT